MVVMAVAAASLILHHRRCYSLRPSFVVAASAAAVVVVEASPIVGRNSYRHQRQQDFLRMASVLGELGSSCMVIRQLLRTFLVAAVIEAFVMVVAEAEVTATRIE